jgi:uncharacterized FAD-dependent dehydrogenase
MERTVDLALSPRDAADPRAVQEEAERVCGWAEGEARGVRVLKRSIDGRSREVRVRLRVVVSSDGPLAEVHIARPVLRDVRGAEPVIVVGSGPAGLFAALRALELGRRPILLERGKDVRARRHDLAAITQRGVVDPESNYCFGEGGAGTYSDGKLYTRSGKRGDIEAVLRTLVAFGASADILVDAHPHIGTNKLPGIIAAMREAIEGAGGEVRFGAKVVDLLFTEKAQRRAVRGVVLESGEELPARAVVLATGHSARDVFRLLARRQVRLQAKDFAVGVRIEHPQAVIDAIRYHTGTSARDPHLPAASYAAVEQVDGRGVYAFCMCPGGIIAPCATENDEVVTNGWSPSKRNNPFANSGIVVEVKVSEGAWAAENPLVGIDFQRELETAAARAGGGAQVAPAQRMVDFVRGRASRDLPACSYPPGVTPYRVDELLPPDIARRLRGGLEAFGAKMRGYLTNEALVVAVESRTSTPVRIPRDPESLVHPDIDGLYPTGEGAGYAGGIVSAAMDGIRVAERAVDAVNAVSAVSAGG